MMMFMVRILHVGFDMAGTGPVMGHRCGRFEMQRQACATETSRRQRADGRFHNRTAAASTKLEGNRRARQHAADVIQADIISDGKRPE
jgi:hypothetical protein